MTVVRFNYRDAKGEVTERELVQWSENSIYLQGRSPSDTFPKTYRKDRIIEFLIGADLLLHDAAPPAPEVRPKPNAIEAPAVALKDYVPAPAVLSQNQILFTGFAASLRTVLEEKASAYGLKVMKSAGKTLTLLCYGENAGPTKVAKAQEAGAFIIDVEQFHQLIATGEIS